MIMMREIEDEDDEEYYYDDEEQVEEEPHNGFKETWEEQGDDENEGFAIYFPDS